MEPHDAFGGNHWGGLRRRDNGGDIEYQPSPGKWADHGHQSMPYLAYNNDHIQTEVERYRFNYAAANTSRNVDEQYWDACIRSDQEQVVSPSRYSSYSSYKECNASLRHSAVFETPSLVGTVVYESSEESLFGYDEGYDDFDCKPSPAPAHLKNHLDTNSSFELQRDVSFRTEKAMSSKYKKQLCYNAHKEFHDESPLPTSLTMIEISPSEFLPLRGAAETWRAVQCDFYVPSCCMACELTIFCIQDADYVICPTCHSVSPVDGAISLDESVGRRAGLGGGVGLGFTYDDLAKWQEDIAVTRLHESTAW